MQRIKMAVVGGILGMVVLSGGCGSEPQPGSSKTRSGSVVQTIELQPSDIEVLVGDEARLAAATGYMNGVLELSERILRGHLCASYADLVDVGAMIDNLEQVPRVERFGAVEFKSLETDEIYQFEVELNNISGTLNLTIIRTHPYCISEVTVSNPELSKYLVPE
jgi:hypothetical protein